MVSMKVKKRDGLDEPYSEEKINKAPEWATEGLHASASAIVMGAVRRFYDGMTTDQVHEALIQSAKDLITADKPDYQFAVTRLAVFLLHKRLYGKFEVPHLKVLVDDLVAKGHYDRDVVEAFNDAEWEELNTVIDHTRNMHMNFSKFEVLETKYMIKNRVTGEIHETPQLALLMMAAALFHRCTPANGYPEGKRMALIRKAYDAFSVTNTISFPTPISAGMRGTVRQFSSCTVIDFGDSLDSINESTVAASIYAANRAGIGMNLGRIRSENSPVRNGDVSHTGQVPFVKQVAAAIKAVHQGGIRPCSGTVFFPIWTLDVESLIVLKNNRGTEENRQRNMDYAFQFNGLLYRRLLANADITLFSPSDTPGLYESFFRNQSLFEELYTRYEADPTIRKKRVKAADIFTLFVHERSSTGRIYFQNVDHANTNSAFNAELAPVYMSNLCLEISIPTKPIMERYDPESGEIGLCTLAAFNMAELKLEDLGEAADLVVTALDEILDYQDYPHPAGRRGGQDRRPLGVGVTGMATFIARLGGLYSDDVANVAIHEYFERMQFELLRASMELAKIKGRCKLFHETTYAQGILPIDRYNKAVDSIVPNDLKCDWEWLRGEIAKYGLRNSTVTALMPCETSSHMTGTPNGIEPVRGRMMYKSNKSRVMKLVFADPGPGNRYEFLWAIPNNKGIIRKVAIMQKFVDQSISLNLNYDPSKYPSGKVPMQDIIGDMIDCWKYGIKTGYYHNTRDGSEDQDAPEVFVDENDDGCEGGACKI